MCITTENSCIRRKGMIEVNNLKMSYGKREVLRDISFQIAEGKIVGLLGVNGAGKSTIMNILTGYLKPQEGEIYINQIDMRKRPKEAKKHVGYLPEIPPLYKDMKVVEYLTFAADIKGIKGKKEEPARVMKLLDIEDRQFDYIKNLSKGLQQRVGFAQVLLGNPPIMILDEPLVGLDPEEAKKTRELIRNLQKEHTIIISSHILTEIEELCNEILMLKDGKIVLDDSMADAKRKGNRNVYKFVIKGDKEAIEKCLEDYEALRTIQYAGEKENGIFEFIGIARNTRDIRDSIFGYLVSKKFRVYGIEKIEASLEDVFIEMNNKEEE